MRKKTLILFFLPFSLNVYSQMDTTTMLQFKINPLLMISQKEIGGIFEYYLRQRFSVEAGGGINVNYSYPWEISNLGIRFKGGEGFILVTGLRYYYSQSQPDIYFNPVFFYRYMTYQNRYYESSSPIGSDISEPGIMNIGNNGGSDRRYGERGDENKQVFAFEALFGWKKLWFKRFTVDIYLGLGLRYIYKQKEISFVYDYISRGLDRTSFYFPSKEKIIRGELPTIHIGFQIEFPLKRKKHFPEPK